MLSIDKVKELLGGKTVSDQEAEEIRDACHALASLMFDAWKMQNFPEREDNDADSVGHKAEEP